MFTHGKVIKKRHPDGTRLDNLSEKSANKCARAIAATNVLGWAQDGHLFPVLRIGADHLVHHLYPRQLRSVATTMAFITPLSVPFRPRPAHSWCVSMPSPAASPAAPACIARMSAGDGVPTAQPQSLLRTQHYGPQEDVCTFGDECCLPDEVVEESPALEQLVAKYVFPMREHNTQVFFDNSLSDSHTIMIVFAEDRHGLVLDVVSVLKALSIRVHRTASSESDALQVMLHRIEGELRSIRELGISLENYVAFWITDEASGEKVFDDGLRLDQLTSCVKLELNTPYPRPRPSSENDWHRISVQKNRADRYTAISVQTIDRPRLLAELTNAFASAQIDIASAVINTFSERVENTFFVTKRGFKQPLAEEDIKIALRNVARALLKVGKREPHETLWYQVRDGTAVIIAEAILIDEVNNRELAMFRFSQFETPNFRGRLPDVPYCPVRLDSDE
ncbi:unnamed protein product [Agarophyton chilense]